MAVASPALLLLIPPFCSIGVEPGQQIFVVIVLLPLPLHLAGSFRRRFVHAGQTRGRPTHFVDDAVGLPGVLHADTAPLPVDVRNLAVSRGEKTSATKEYHGRRSLSS